MAVAARSPSSRLRLEWLDIVKGLSILWIVFFHCFGTYINDRLPSPTGPQYFRSFLSQCAASTAMSAVWCAIEAALVAVARLGFHAVSVFLVLSGFGLTYALSGSPASWRQWYRRRLLRLFPMYWVAHLLYLVSPFVARPEPIDYRFTLSFLGDRVYPVYSIFYYANPAWWYFGLLLQLYLIFPLLFRLLARVGWLPFVCLCIAFTVTVRYLLLNVLAVHGYYVQGAFFGSRLWEFAIGVACGHLCRASPETWQRRLFALPTLAIGIFIYMIGLYTYSGMTSYVLTDGLIGSGLFIILAHLARWCEEMPRVAASLARVGAYSYGLYLVHQPYVTYFAERMRPLGMTAFLLFAWTLVAALTLAAIPLERSVNRLVDHFLGAKKGVAPMPAAIGRTDQS